ncbi:hypothetical protein [Virgibacillus siamensis]|uniref:hypothetical protein n=1 Tax=Virgibacillus siamensis TaxID=480071 RepID=UPI00098664A6|nr:hypothetical protein [Virgibacillus siamensis]
MVEVKCQQGESLGNEIICISISGMKIDVFGEEIIQLGPHCLRISQETFTVEQLTVLYGLFENIRLPLTGYSTQDRAVHLKAYLDLLYHLHYTTVNGL